MIGFRRATPADAVGLTELTLASKAYWGYDQDFMDRARPSLTVTRDYLDANECWIAESDEDAVGWFSLVRQTGGVLLDNFFVDPAHIGSGVGRLMWQESLARAEASGATRLTLEADPNAAGFYEQMGARLIGSVRAPITNRELPLYEVLIKTKGSG